MVNKLMPTDDPNVHYMHGDNGVKYIVRSIYNENGKSLQDIVVNLMLSDYYRPKRNQPPRQEIHKD